MRLRASFSKILCALGLLVAIGIGSARFTQASSTDLPVDEVVVKVRRGVSIGTVTARYGAIVSATLTENNVYFLKLGPGQTADALLPTLNSDADLVSAEPNYYADLLPDQQQRYIDAHGAFPNVEQRYIDAHAIFLDAEQRYIDAHGSPAGTADMWAWSKLGLTDARKISTGQGIIVAVLDTGLAPDHPLLNSSLTAGYDFVGMTNDIYDRGNGLDDDGDGKIDEGTGHGTHIAGIIVSTAPGVQIMPVRVLDSDGVGTYWEVAAGIRFAVDHGAKVINLSLSAPRIPPALQAALDYAVAHGVIIVTAAGTGDGPNYPAAYADPLILGVGATDRLDAATSFSGGGPSGTTVYAPGVDILSSYPYNGYVYGSGTSMSAAIVSAEAALLRSHYPDWTPQQVVQRITSKTVPVSTTLPGRVDLVAALSTGLEARYMIGDIGSPGDAQLKPRLQIMNHTAITIPLSELKLRYWYTIDGDKPQSFWCDYSSIGCSNIIGSFFRVTPSRSGADDYLEVGFTAGAGNLFPGQQSGEIVLRVNKNDWSNYNETDDYSYDPSKGSYLGWSHVTIYRQGTLIWGNEPGVTSTPPVPSATNTSTALPPPATKTATPTPTATRTSSPTPTATNTSTALPPTATKTSTPLPTVTSTPLPAPTATTTGTVSVLALNSGGSAMGTFLTDAGASGGNSYSTNAAIDTNSVYNPAPQAVYQTERWSSSTFTYTLSNLSAGRSHLVRLHFAELVMSGPNQRQFNVAINGMPLLNNYDIFAAAGAQNKAVVWEISVAASNTGQIIIVFSKGNRDNPKVNGIEVIKQ
jgi:subtilisin family serine protease